MAVGSTTQMPLKIETAIKKAAVATGADFQYLVDTAKRESGFRASVKAPTSSATGLFQFIESTWLQMVKDKGPELGLGDVAQHITKTSSGKYRVENAEKRQEILELRKKPEVAALMAGAFTQQNSQALEGKIGRKPTSGELYIAHFLGAHNGGKLIQASSLKPEMKASELFPKAANSNKSLFYRGGNAVSVKGLYQNLVRRHSVQQIDIAQNKQAAKITELASIEQPIILQGAAITESNKNQIASAIGGEFKQQSGQIFQSGMQNTLFAARDVDMVASIQKQAPNKGLAITTEQHAGFKTNVTTVSMVESHNSNRNGAIGVWDSFSDQLQSGKDGSSNNKQRPILDLGADRSSEAKSLFQKGGLGTIKS